VENHFILTPSEGTTTSIPPLPLDPTPGAGRVMNGVPGLMVAASIKLAFFTFSAGIP
jgi:hypothetical protein